jgi:hypothetical protein
VLTHESVFHFHLWHVWPDSIKMHEERASRQKDDETVPKGAIPAYLLDREGESRSKVRGQQRIRPCSALRYATVGAYLGRVCVCAGAEQHGQAEAQGKGRQVERAAAAGQGGGGGRGLQGAHHRQEAEYGCGACPLACL